jgi:transposase
VAAALELQKAYLEQKKKVSKQKDKHVKRPQVRHNVCKFFRISASTYSKIMGNYLKENQAYVSGKQMIGRAGNTMAKDTRIPRTERLRLDVRDFVRARRKDKSRVTARQVLEYFLEKKHLVIPLDAQGRFEKVPFKSAYRATRRWLSDFGGYQRGKRKNLVPSEQQVAKRHTYLREFFGNRAKPPQEQLREVYTDQSYIHEHYHRNDDSIWDPNDEQDVQYSKDKHKGRRYCFAHAIQGANPRVEEPTLPTDKPGLVPGALWAFCPQKKGDHQGDYHKVFNGENIVAWFKNDLLPNLLVPSLIILDNAKYHHVYGPDVPKPSKMKKQECADYLASKGVEFDASMSAVELKQLVKKYIEDNIPIEIVRLATEKGHKVLFTPPYHSDLQPIELVWARVKGNVGRQYNNESTLELVYQRLLAEFESLSVAHDSVHGMIEKCTKVAQKFYDEIEEDDAVEEEMADDDGSDDSGVENEDDDDANELDIDLGDDTEGVGDGDVTMGLIGPAVAI